MKLNRKVLWMCVFSLAACLVAENVAVAQRRGGDGERGGRRGGFRGFGFGRGGFSMGPMQLLGNSAVQKELDLSTEQVAEVNKLTEAYRAEQRDAGGRPDFSRLRDLSDEERREAFEEMRKKREEAQKKLDAKYDPKIAELLDPPQADRLDQVVLQLKGVEALTEEATAQALGLSKAQQEKIAAINNDYEAKRRELFSGFGRRGRRGDDEERGGRGGRGGGFEAFAQMRELGEKRDTDVMAVLTADQKKTWEEMKGEEFDRRELFQGFGRRGGRGGRDGDRERRGGRPPM